MQPTAASAERNDPGRLNGVEECLPGGMADHVRPFAIVETGAAQFSAIQIEPQGLDEVQTSTRVDAQAYDVAGIRRNLGLVEDNVQHGAASYDPPDPILRTRFCGLDFASPLVLLSGCVGFGDEYTRVAGFSNRDAGAVCLKGTTLAPRLGNPAHRLYETPAGLLNAIGLQNPGVDAVVRNILPQLDFSETRFIANVSGSTVAEYVEVTRRFDESPIDAIELNISCPNVKAGGVQFGNDPEMSAQVVAACRAATTKPLIVKLSPNQTDIADNARRCIDAGADAFAAINTLTGMAIDIERRRPVLGNGQGGLSGPAIKPIALLRVHQVYQVAAAHGVPIIGQGGIASAQDAIEFLLAGASAVGVGTALFYDPLICRQINDGIADYLQRHQLGQLTDLVGKLQPAEA